MAALRQSPPQDFAGVPILAWEDYKSRTRKEKGGSQQPLALPQSDVLRYFLEGGAWMCIRPSGTEPKLKLYIGANAPAEEEVDALLSRLMNAADEKLSSLLA